MNNDVAVIDTADVAARVKNYKEHLLQLGLSWRQFAKKLFGLTEEQLSVLLYSSPIRTWEQLTSPEQKIYGRMDSWMKKMAKKEQDATLGPLCFCRQQLDELMVTCMSNEKCVGYTWYHQECLIGRAIGVIDDDFLCPDCSSGATAAHANQGAVSETRANTVVKEALLKDGVDGHVVDNILGRLAATKDYSP